MHFRNSNFKHFKRSKNVQIRCSQLRWFNLQFKQQIRKKLCMEALSFFRVFLLVALKGSCQ